MWANLYNAAAYADCAAFPVSLGGTKALELRRSNPSAGGPSSRPEAGQTPLPEHGRRTKSGEAHRVPVGLAFTLGCQGGGGHGWPRLRGN